MNLTLTQWFSPNVMPIHVGVYQRGVPAFHKTLHMYSYWDGKDWYVGSSTFNGAKRYYKRGNRSILTNPSWRGIAQQPI
jgi:hypothetical protein